MLNMSLSELHKESLELVQKADQQSKLLITRTRKVSKNSMEMKLVETQDSIQRNILEYQKRRHEPLISQTERNEAEEIEIDQMLNILSGKLLSIGFRIQEKQRTRTEELARTSFAVAIIALVVTSIGILGQFFVSCSESSVATNCFDCGDSIIK